MAIFADYLAIQIRSHQRMGTLKKMKKFRFQLLHEFIISQYPRMRVADIGGGKGLLSYLLLQDGWEATVIDPVYQHLPLKYTSLDKKKIRLTQETHVPHITGPFEVEMGKQFDLLVGLHAHGSNLKVIESAQLYHKSFILIPCCIIQEGIDPYSITDWLAYIEKRAGTAGMKTKRMKLDFKGQRTAIISC